MPVTALYAGALGLWFALLSVRVVLSRVGPERPGLGDGGNPLMLRVIRGHANFAEYVPLVLLLIGVAELGGLSRWALHLLGATLLLGRLLHGYALSFTQGFVAGRSVGIVLTLVALVVASGVCLVLGLQGL